MISLESNEKNSSIHIWEGVNKTILISFEDTKSLYSYKSIDDAINSLYIDGYNNTARKLQENK